MKPIGFVVLGSALAITPLLPATAQDLLWTRQFGTTADDRSSGVAVDSAGNAYITGVTEGSLFGANAGDRDIILAKYDALGTLLWTRQFGTPWHDFGWDVAVDGVGNVYITGETEGDLAGPNAGPDDAILAKYDASGTLLWMRQFGTTKQDVGYSVDVEGAGNTYITGQTHGSLGGPHAGTEDAFLAKYDAAGTLLWTRQMGTSEEDRPSGVAVDGAGNAYVAGGTPGSLGGPNAGSNDVFLAKYDDLGTLLWIRQFGTPESDGARGVAVDGEGNVYITGYTSGSLGGPNAGIGFDYFLAKYHATGAQLWIRQFGSPETESGSDVAVDGEGNVYITGGTEGSLGGPNVGSYDAFIVKYDALGVLLWTHQFGSPESEGGGDVAVNGEGDAYITGTTRGSLGGQNAGLSDCFLTKYGDATCYPDCDQSTGAGVLDIWDFLCFQNRFVFGEPYACGCDTATGAGVCDVFDFLCFQDAFVGGCP